MDPITLIVTAIAGGAAAGASDVATQAVRDAYAGLKALVIRKFGSTGAVAANLQQVEAEPDNEIWQAALQQGLTQAGADSDQEALARAQALLDLIAQLGLGTGNTNIAHAEGSSVIAQDHSVAAGEGGVAIQGDVHGNIVTGDRNIIGNVVGDVDMSDRRVEQQGKYNVHIDKAEGLRIGDEASAGSSLAPADEIAALESQRTEQQRQLLALERELIGASGRERARLQVAIDETRQTIRALERKIDLLHGEE